MPNDVKLKYASVNTTVTVSGLNSLGAGTIATSNVIDNSSFQYEDVLFMLNVANFTCSGNQMVFLYCVSSFDNASFSVAAAGYTGIMAPLGHVPLVNPGSWLSRSFSSRRAFGGTLPPYFKVVVYNDAGATFAASGNVLYSTSVLRQIV